MESHKLQPQLRQGKIVPNFILPIASGATTGPGSLRSKYNMVLVFVGEGEYAEAYLRSLSDAYTSILDEQARAIAIRTGWATETQELQKRLAFPFPLLIDGDGSLTGRMIGRADLAALCVADRFGEIYSLEIAPDAAQLPSMRNALEWLQYIQVQCPE